MIEPTVVRHEMGAERVGALALDWEELVQVTECAHPSAPFPVVKGIVSHKCGTHGAVHAWLVHRDGVTIAAAVGVQEPLPYSGGQQCRTPGDHDAYPLPLLVRNADGEAVAALLRAALSSETRIVRFCLLRQVDAGFWRKVFAHAPDLCFMQLPAGRSSYLPVPSSESALWDALSANFRKNLRKQRRRLDATAGVDWRFLSGTECSEAEIERFLHLEASGWKAQRGGAILRRPKVAEYYRAVLRALADDGRLELHQLFVQGRCVAVQVGVRLQGTLCLLKIAYDETVARLAPGNMLFLELLRREIAAGGCREIDCLTDMPWHRNWAMHQRELFDVHVYPKTWRALLLAYAPRAARAWAQKNPSLLKARNLVRDLLRSRLPNPASPAR